MNTNSFFVYRSRTDDSHDISSSRSWRRRQMRWLRSADTPSSVDKAVNSPDMFSNMSSNSAIASPQNLEALLGLGRHSSCVARRRHIAATDCVWTFFWSLLSLALACARPYFDFRGVSSPIVDSKKIKWTNRLEQIHYNLLRFLYYKIKCKIL